MFYTIELLEVYLNNFVYTNRLFLLTFLYNI